MASRTLPMALGLIGAIALSQFPEFVQQYTQRVGGAYEEVAATATQFRTNTEISGQTTEEALRALENGGGLVASQAAQMRATLARESSLSQLYDGLQQTDGYNQLWAFLRYPQPDLTVQTAEVFRPAVPLTFDGGAYAALGFLGGYFFLRFPQMLFIGRRRRRERARLKRQMA